MSQQMPNLKVPSLAGDAADKLPWAYRGLLALALVSTLLPWVTVSGSASMNYGDAQRDVSGMMPAGFGGGNMPQMQNQSVSGSVSLGGLSTTWGVLALAAAAAGVVLSFLGPHKLLAEKDKLTMAGIGGVVALLAIIMLMSASGYVKGNANMQTQYASSSGSASVGFGVYLCILSSLVAGGLGFIVDWRGQASQA